MGFVGSACGFPGLARIYFHFLDLDLFSGFSFIFGVEFAFKCPDGGGDGGVRALGVFADRGQMRFV